MTTVHSADPPGDSGEAALLDDLQSDLMNIAGFAALIRSHRTDPGCVLRYCDAVERAAGHASGLAGALARISGSRSPSTSPDVVPTRERGAAVLLVEDDEGVLSVERDLLSMQGYPVLTAGDGAEGVEVFRRHREEIGLVVLDLIMPRMDGGQAYLAMKQIDPDVRAFFCTAHTSSELMRSLLAEEELRTLRKPFDANEFLAMVGEMVGAPARGGPPPA